MSLVGSIALHLLTLSFQLQREPFSKAQHEWVVLYPEHFQSKGISIYPLVNDQRAWANYVVGHDRTLRLTLFSSPGLLGHNKHRDKISRICREGVERAYVNQLVAAEYVGLHKVKRDYKKEKSRRTVVVQVPSALVLVSSVCRTHPA